MLTVGSLFAGIGGFDLGLERAGMQVKWQVEIDPYCLKVLEKHWPHVKRYTDIKTVDWSTIEPVNLVCGGFPCQPVSVAGKRKGTADERWLWPEFVRCLERMRPRWVLLENVLGLWTSGIDSVRQDLTRLGYKSRPLPLSSCMFGASHTRRRLFIVSHAKSFRCQRRRSQEETQRTNESQGCLEAKNWTLEDAPKLERVVNEFPYRVDRLKAIGNSVDPQVVEWIGRQIIKAEEIR